LPLTIVKRKHWSLHSHQLLSRELFPIPVEQLSWDSKPCTSPHPNIVAGVLYVLENTQDGNIDRHIP
jgi:hypothetical protein